MSFVYNRSSMVPSDARFERVILVNSIRAMWETYSICTNLLIMIMYVKYHRHLIKFVLI